MVEADAAMFCPRSVAAYLSTAEEFWEGVDEVNVAGLTQD